MTKKKIFLSIFAIALLSYFWRSNSEREQIQSVIAKKKVEKQLTKTEPAPTLQVVKGNRTPASIKAVNTESTHWENDLRESLVTQGGKFIKDIQITKERSFTFTKDRTPLHAHTVKIELKTQNDEASSFRAIVDASTGKILETYDRTHFDPIGHNRKPASFKAQPVFQ